MFAAFIALAVLAQGCGGSTDDSETRRVSHEEDRSGERSSVDDGRTGGSDEAPDGQRRPSSDSATAELDPVTVSTVDPSQTGTPDDTTTAPDEDDQTEPADQDETDPAPDTTSPDPSSSTGSATPLAFLNDSDTRAMWVWSETPSAKQLVENVGGAQDELMQFAAAPHGKANRSLNRLFFEARGHSNVDRFAQTRPVTYDPLLDSSKQADLRAFLKRAHAQGMDVEYLDGQAIWVANDTNAEVPKQICQDVVSFNLTTNDITERFDGVHFDIEPHTVRSGPYAGVWWQNKLPNGYNADWTQRWKDIMNSCRSTFDAYEAQTGHKLVLASDVGADYAYYNKPILDFFNGPNSPIDYIGIMNYYDNKPNENGQPSFFWGDHDGSNVTGGVEQNLDYWTGLPVLFGVETGPTSIAPDHMSFYQEGYTSLYSVVDQLETSYGSTNSLGIAIHHYSPGSYKDLQP